MADRNREIRAMILAALPYPPLPLVTCRHGEDNLLGDRVEQTTHDALSHLLEYHGGRNDEGSAMVRQERQRGVLREFLAALVKDGIQAPPALYETYARYTRLHIGTYFEEGRQPEVLIPPYDVVCKGDPTHRRMCDYVAGQARLLELSGGLCAQDWAHREYTDLLRVCQDRLVTEGAAADDLEAVPAAG